jgi:hypothetical protein
MSVHMVQAKIGRESVTDVQAAAERMFAASRAEPANVQPLTVIGSYRMF